MTTLTERLNITFSEKEEASIFKNIQLGFSSYDNLCLACSEQNIDSDSITDAEFDNCVETIQDFINSANESIGFTVSIWFDAK